MAKWFRSEPMEYISIIMNEDAAHDCLADLGNLGAIQFTDVRWIVREDPHIFFGIMPHHCVFYITLVEP